MKLGHPVPLLNLSVELKSGSPETMFQAQVYALWGWFAMVLGFYAIGGALSLYINFINLFLALLRIFSARN